MTAQLLTNNRPQRKQLCEQIDRLDLLLDGLSNALNESVVDAVRDGTRLAVKDAIIEILTDPNLRAKLQQVASPEADSNKAKRPGVIARFVAKVRGAVTAIRQSLQRASQSVTNGANSVARTSSAGLQFVRTFGNLHMLILIAMFVGAAAGAGSYFAPHTIAAALSGVSSGLAAIGLQVGLIIRRAYRVMSAL